jgi:hypothetical protein
LLALVITRLLGGMRWIIDVDRVYWVHLLYVLNFLVLTSTEFTGSSTVDHADAAISPHARRDFSGSVFVGDRPVQ